MPIKVSCHSCGGKFNAPDAAAGKKTKCPKCGGVIEIPTPGTETPAEFFASPEPAAPPKDEVYEAEPVPSGLFDDEDFNLDPPPPLPETGGDRKPCPLCGEMIQRDAVKCRHCGEIFDPVLKKRQKHTSAADADMTTFDWVLAILCSTIGCIMGIIYIAQGKPKGKKMLLVSLGVVIFWNVFGSIIGFLSEAPR